MHFSSTSLFFLKKIIDSCLNINAKFRGRQLLRAEFVLFPLSRFHLQTIITAEALRPYRVVVQHADLVLLAAAVHAHYERLLF